MSDPILSFAVAVILYMIAFHMLDRYEVPFWTKLAIAGLFIVGGKL